MADYAPVPEGWECPRCGAGTASWVEEVRTGWNGACSDEGTGYDVLVCDGCGEAVVLDGEAVAVFVGC